MRVILDLALSVDGYIATTEGDSEWVSPRTESLFKQRIQEAGALVVGSKTFQQYKGTIYPVEGALNIVLSSSSLESQSENVVCVSTPEEAVKVAAERNCKGLLIAGGASVSRAFLERKLIDEIYFSRHPIKLGTGLPPFGEMEVPANLVLLDTLDLGEGIVQEHFAVSK